MRVAPLDNLAYVDLMHNKELAAKIQKQLDNNTKRAVAASQQDNWRTEIKRLDRQRNMLRAKLARVQAGLAV